MLHETLVPALSHSCFNCSQTERLLKVNRVVQGLTTRRRQTELESPFTCPSSFSEGLQFPEVKTCLMLLCSPPRQSLRTVGPAHDGCSVNTLVWLRGEAQVCRLRRHWRPLGPRRERRVRQLLLTVTHRPKHTPSGTKPQEAMLGGATRHTSWSPPIPSPRPHHTRSLQLSSPARCPEHPETMVQSNTFQMVGQDLSVHKLNLMAQGWHFY